VQGVRRLRELVADRKKMEGHCSTGQSPQRAVVSMEEEEEYLTAIGLTPGGSSTVFPTIYSRCSIYTTHKQQMHNLFNCQLYLKKLQHVSMPQRVIMIREFSCYTTVTCQLKYSPLVRTLKVLIEYRYQVVNIVDVTYSVTVIQNEIIK